VTVQPHQPSTAFKRLGPAIPASPVVLSVPHAGRAYSASLLKASRHPRAALELLEDRLVDQLIWRATAAGATAIVALAPRAEIDLNRDVAEIDRSMILSPGPEAADPPSARTRGGLGLIPSRIAGAGPIWRQRLPRAELDRRIEAVHRPYHQALSDALDSARARFGIAILLDCHSMPPRPDAAGEIVAVLGDRHGTSMAPHLLDAALAALDQAGVPAALNDPYAGGYITARHGRPAENLHALQLELDRSFYLAADLRTPGPGFDRASALIAALAAALADAALKPPLAIAAE
jgi:N-formylglutamate amidohydrolase